MLKILRVFVGVGVALAAVGLNVGVSHATPDGEWSTFENVPGLVAAHPNGGSVNSVSCASPGNCSAVGYYSNNSGNQAFVVSQVDGVWGSYEDVPGFIAANTRGEAFLSSVSCASVGNCSAVGYYSTGSSSQTFVTSISTSVTDPTTSTDAPTIDSSTTVPSIEVASGSHDPYLTPATTVVVTNLPATGRGSSSTVLVSLMLILSGALVVSCLRRWLS